MKILALVLGLLSVSAWAGDSSTGCGLGWQVAPKQSLVSATTRTITNATFSNQIFGTTSGTSGCAKHSIVKRFEESLHFANFNSDRLKIEMAQGQGEYVTAYAATFGCDSLGSTMFSQKARQLNLSSQATGEEMVVNTVQVLGPELKGHCALF